MPASVGLSPRALAPAVVILVGLGLVLAFNLPGHLSYDSIVQLWEGRRGIYLNWHPPVMSFLLGVGDALVPGTALFVVFDSLLLFGSLLAILAFRPRPSWAATAVAALCVATPQFVLYPGIVWKDVLFAGAILAGFVSIAHAADHWHRTRWRWSLLGCAVVVIALAALTRQNGVLMALFAASAIGLVAAMRTAERRVRAGFAYGGGALACMILLVTAASAALATRIVGPSSPATQFRLLETYDIAGALALAPKLALDRVHDDDPALEQVLRSEAARLYTPERNDTLASSAKLQRALQHADEATIPAQWRSLVIEHPWLYLAVRAGVFGWLVLPPNPMACHPYFVGISGPPGEMRELGVSPRWDRRDQGLQDYVALFVGTPIMAHVTYLFLALFELYLLVRRRSPSDVAMAAMLVSALAFTATFFVISIACDYRYLYALDVSALAALFYLALDGTKAAHH